MSTLPDHITAETIRNASDLVAETEEGQEDLDAIDEAMSRHLEAVIVELATRHNLDDEQVEELHGRIGWRLELLQ